MEKALEHDPCHVRTREHYEAMVRELQQEAAVAAAGRQPVVSEFRAQQERVRAALARGTRITLGRVPL